jgi:hypothetical protein
VLERAALAVDRVIDLVLERIDFGAFGLAFVGRHRAERLQQLGDRALLAERGDARRFKSGLVPRGVDRRENFGFQLLQIGHGRILSDLTGA